MAANTAINFTLQAKDWETLAGIISVSADPEIQELLYSLQLFYKAANPKPAQGDNVTIATNESAIVKLSAYLYGNTVMNVFKDVGQSPMGRIMTAIRAANNAADNYITNTLATNDTNYANVLQQIKKNGRKFILMLSYDNN